MYESYETETSMKYLDVVLGRLAGRPCLLGGWAVYKTVDEKYSAQTGRAYLGSRDIDLGFHIDPKWTAEDLKTSDFALTISTLEKRLGFELQGFRMLKQFHTESREVLDIETARNVPSPFIFPLYVDLMVDNFHEDFKEAFGFVPADESLMVHVFEEKDYRQEIKLGKKKLYLPKPEVLIAMKLKAITGRDKEQKMIKDVCDVFALCWYSEYDFNEIGGRVQDFMKKKADLKRLTDDIYAQAAKILDIERTAIKRTFESFQ